MDPNGAMSNLWLILFADFTFFTSRCLIMSIINAYVENCHTCNNRSIPVDSILQISNVTKSASKSTCIDLHVDVDLHV